MGTVFRVILLFFFSPLAILAQSITCPSPFVYMDSGNFIQYYDPSQPLGPNNPVTTNIPTFGSGLTLMPNINGGSPSPTFYSVSGGTYWYWDGTNWVNTNHQTGNGAAVNLGGCNGTLYNLVGFSGQIYAYNGSGNGTLLTTIAGFNGGGPYDLVTDCNCNFYVLNTTSPNQGLTMYSPNGQVQCTYSLSGMPNTSAGGGFAIIGNTIYVKNNLNNGFFIGTIAGSAVTFTQVNGFNASPGDFASCPVCNPSPNLGGVAVTGAQLSCVTSSANLVVMSNSGGPYTYQWSGPGILGPSNQSLVAVNAPGVYSVIVSAGGCPPAQTTLTTAVTSNTSVVTAVLTPSGSICVPGNPQTLLTVAHSSTNEVVSWAGPNVINSPNSSTYIATGIGAYTVTVTNPSNGCFAQDVVTLAQTPTVSTSLSSVSLCSQSLNNSPATLTITPFGANAYTLLTSSNYNTASPNGPTMPVNVLNNSTGLATGTLIGQNAFCGDTSYFSFMIMPNPVLQVASASICPGKTHVFNITGANSYVWTGNNLSPMTGATVSANPTVTTVYNVIGSSAGCNSGTYSPTLTVLPVPIITVQPATSTICLGTTVNLSGVGASSFTWFPAIGLTATTGINVGSSPPSNQMYNVIGALNGCTNIASATVNVVQPPVLSMSLSSGAICYNNFNGSLNSLTITPGGATNYTLLAASNFSVAQPNGPFMQIMPAGPPVQGVTLATATLIGNTSVCTVSITENFNIVANPTITISPPSASICPGGSHIFTANGATSYFWAPSPTLFTLSPNSVIANPSLTSFYSVYGTQLGCRSDTRNAVLVVLPIPKITVVPKTTTVCAGNSVSLTTISNADSFSWTPAGSLSSSTNYSVMAGPSATEFYTVTAFLNTCTNQAVAMVSVIPMPVLTASATQSVICSSASTMLKAEGANSFSWTPSFNLNASTGNMVVASPAENTTYSVTGFNGICTGTTTVFVQTIARPEMTITSVNNQNAICLDDYLLMETAGAQHFEWFPPGFASALGSNTLYIVKPNVTTNFTIVGANYVGDVFCYQQLSYSVTVVPKIQPKMPALVSLCEGDKTTLVVSGGNTYKWWPSAGLNSTDAPRVVASPKETTIYTVEVSHDTYCATTGTVKVEVSPRPIVIAGRDTSYHINEPIFIESTGTGTLSWVAGEAIACIDCPITQAYPTRNGCYIVEAVNEFGCYAQDDICITLREDYTIYLPNTFTPDKDGLNDVFYVYGENFYNLKMEIFDRWGTLLFASGDQRLGWDGSFRGTPCKQDTYIYKVSYTGLDRKTYHLTGHVNLLR